MALACGGIAIAYAAKAPHLFGKTRSGTLPFWSWLLYTPTHAFNFLALKWFRHASRREIWAHIEPDLWLGPRLGPREARCLIDEGAVAVLDVAAELSEVAAVRTEIGYLSLPVLDTRAPEVDGLRRGVEWVKQKRTTGPVYIHCALGHGRSATFVAACLLESGSAQNIDEAVALISKARPVIKLHPEQREILEAFLKP